MILASRVAVRFSAFLRSPVSSSLGGASTTMRSFSQSTSHRSNAWGSVLLGSASIPTQNSRRTASIAMRSPSSVTLFKPAVSGGCSISIRTKFSRAKKKRGLDAMPEIDLMSAPRIKLNHLANVPGSVKKKIRVGRGRGGRRGKTSGRGHKGGGQHGASLPFWFQGGQAQIWKTSPKIGRPYTYKMKYVPLNLNRLGKAIERGKLDPKYPINLYHLKKAGVVSGSFKSIGVDCWGVKLLSTGVADFKYAVDIEVQRASKSAIAAIEAAGGTIRCKYYNKLGLRALCLPEKFPLGIPRLPMPRPKLRRWYEDSENRGVLPPVIEGEVRVSNQQLRKARKALSQVE